MLIICLFFTLIDQKLVDHGYVLFVVVIILSSFPLLWLNINKETWCVPQFYVKFKLLFSFLCSVLQIIICPFVLFLLAIALYVLPIYGFWLPLWNLQTFLSNTIVLYSWKNNNIILFLLIKITWSGLIYG
jgi:hypothetical protein